MRVRSPQNPGLFRHHTQRARFDRRGFLALTGAAITASGAQAAAPAVVKTPENVEEDLSGLAPRFDLKTEYLFSRRTHIRREIIGPVAEGFRVNIYTESGKISGPRINGTSGAGGDWFTIRRDGMGIVDSRVMIHEQSGVLIYCAYTGMTDFGPDAYQLVVQGDPPKPGKIFVAARFQTAHPKFEWLNRVQAIGVGINEGDSNLWDTYAMR